MTKRIFCGVFFVALAIIVIFICVPKWIAAAISTLLAVGCALWAAFAITRPIKQLNPDLSGSQPPYKELKPLFSKLQRQTLTIRDQTVDLFRQQEEFRTISENMSEGLLVVDHNGTVLSYNTAALRLLDVEPQDNQNVLTFTSSRRFRKAVNEALSGNHSQQLMNLSERTYQIIGNPVFEEQDPIGAVLMILDVTEREERDRLRKEFSANVSHELKTPLTSISGFAEIMMHGLAKAEDTPYLSGKIYEEAQRLIAMVGDIIQLSRLDEKDLLEQMQAVDLYAVAAKVVERLSPNAQKEHIDLRLQGSTCMIDGVAPMLEEILVNLCDNAMKYNREGGHVTVAVLPREQDVLLAVTDNGIGIAYEDQERVFERFFRGDKSHSKQISGTGLGLSIVKHAAAFHNATLNLESVPGEGTTVSLIFPKAE